MKWMPGRYPYSWKSLPFYHSVFFLLSLLSVRLGLCAMYAFASSVGSTRDRAVRMRCRFTSNTLSNTKSYLFHSMLDARCFEARCSMCIATEFIKIQNAFASMYIFENMTIFDSSILLWFWCTENAFACFLGPLDTQSVNKNAIYC